MDNSDSRKRPLDMDSESGVPKRSNQGGDKPYADRQHDMETHSLPGENIHFKVLIPSIAAGAIIGKGGETITQIQKDSGAVIKMSKANDFYPGTTERVCLITGSADAVKVVHQFIMDTIRDKPDPNPRQVEGEQKDPCEADMEGYKTHETISTAPDQVKILVPNSTAGMVIGKGGIFIRQIKEETGAYVQISQKSKDMNLPERCVTVAGDPEQNKRAVEMILQKIIEDPQSASCPNISYADYKGPVASSNPTGSPFANAPNMGFQGNGFNGAPQQGAMGNLGTGMNNLNINSSITNPALDNLKATLRGSGYTEQAVEEISAAMFTLANYGFLGLGLGLGLGGLGQQGTNLSLANLAGILQGGANAGGMLAGGNNAGDNNPSVFGPVGSTTTTMAGGDTGESGTAYFSTAGSDRYGNAGNNSMFGSGYDNGGGFGAQSAYQGTNQNSFGLGTNMGAFGSEEEPEGTKKDVEVGEHIVGAILGPGGKGIVELQKCSGANIQISKKGVYSPGTRNRLVSISGVPSAVQRAQYFIQQRIIQEEAKRARSQTNGGGR